MKRIMLLAMGLYMCSACNAPADSGQERAALDSIRMEHVRAVNSRNADLVLESMAENVVYLAPQLRPISGRHPLESMLRSAYDRFQPRITMTPREVSVHGALAVEWGCLGGELQPLDGGDPIPNQGKYLLVYQWQESLGWKIAKDVYNTGPCE